MILGFDTATPATAVALVLPGREAVEARHDPVPGERPAHVTALLGLVEQVLAEVGAELRDVSLLAVGIGPGSFTGLRIGVATARSLAQACSLPLVGVSTLRALAAGAREQAGPGRPVLVVLDARRGEVFAAAFADEAELLAPAALAPDALAGALASLPEGTLAIGDGALKFSALMEEAGAVVPVASSPLHRVWARHHCKLAPATAAPVGRAVAPDYLRPPDARPIAPPPFSP